MTIAMLTLAEALEKLAAPALSEIATIHQQTRADGPDNFYKGRLERADPIAPYERRLLEAIERLRPASAYHEIGGGIGLVPLTLGLMGYTAVNFEGAQTRIAHGEQILRTLAEQDASLPARVRMVRGWVPEVFSAVETDGACALCTNVGSPRPPEFVDAFLREVQARYSAFIFDLCLLWGVYRTEPEWQDRLAQISTVWGRQPELLFARENYERYYLVRFD